MKIHRFYSGDLHDKRGKLDLAQKIWVHDAQLLHQWVKVLRLRAQEQIVLFDGSGNDRLYKIQVVQPDSVGLELVTVLEPILPKRHSYICWSLLKKDNNDVVLQKCTELGVTNFIPLIADRTEKTGFDSDRAMRILIEAAEQCGRSDIPHVRDPITIKEFLSEYPNKVQICIADQDGVEKLQTKSKNPLGIVIGPEGGWSDNEKQYFIDARLQYLKMSDHTLRAETAAIIAAAQLLQ